jgi:hypothetical protein
VTKSDKRRVESIYLNSSCLDRYRESLASTVCAVKGKEASLQSAHIVEEISGQAPKPGIVRSSHIKKGYRKKI